mgnify:CR=1 FL=1
MPYDCVTTTAEPLVSNVQIAEIFIRRGDRSRVINATSETPSNLETDDGGMAVAAGVGDGEQEALVHFCDFDFEVTAQQ